MRYLLTIGIFLHLTIVVRTQDSTFNYIYTSEDYGIPEFFHSIIHNDTIVGVGSGLYPVEEGYMQGIIAVRFDSTGAIIDSTIIKDPFGGHYGILFQYGKILKSTKGGYLITTLSDANPGGTLIKLNDLLQLEWIETYFDAETGRSIEFQQPIEIEDGYILYGHTGLSLQSPKEPVVYRIDEAGNVVWFNYYGNSNISDIYWGGGELLNDSTIVLGGIGDEGSFVQLIGLDGNLLDEWSPGLDSPIGFLRHIRVTEDKGYIIFADKIIEVEGEANLVQTTMSKVSSDYEIEWILPFGIIETVNANVRLWDIQPTSDGYYIAAGQSVRYDEPFPRRAGWIFKFTAQGDSLWSHIIDPAVPDPLAYFDGQYGGIGELSSGSYVAGGFADNTGMGRFMWLTKVTKNGCLEDFCPELNIVSTKEPFPPSAIEVAPNPGNGVFYIQWQEEWRPSSAAVMVYDITGRLVFQQLMAPNEAINISQQAAGMYLLEVQADNKRWVGRVVKQ